MATTFDSHQQWEPTIGLEVHVQLSTVSKLFSAAATTYGASPNTQTCGLDAALPGTLPVLNQAAVCMAVKFGLSIQAAIAQQTVFERKNYFYPDLPKGYQISQHSQPIISKGHLSIELDNGQQKTVGIIQAHLEEDAGKSLHENLTLMSGIDLNRAGVPLLEIVSEPALHSAKEAMCYLKALYTQVCYLQICDGNLQEGSFRIDVNVSVRPKGASVLGTRVEIKNLNSFRFVEKAINYEVDRQINSLMHGESLRQETRLYDADRNETRVMRSKENISDYRYFPDPDLCPLELTSEFIAEIASQLPELPQQKRERFQQQYGLTPYDANLLVANRALADYFEAVVRTPVPAKLAANWINGELAAALNKANLPISAVPLEAERLGGLLARIVDNTISGNIAKIIFESLWTTAATADEVIAQQGLRQVTDAATITALIQEILAAHPQQLAAYRAGKEALFGFFVGKIMQASGGRFKPQQLNALLKQLLNT